MKKFLFLFWVLTGLQAGSLFAQDPRDTLVMYAKDSAVVPETEPTVLFFQNGEKIPTHLWGKTLLISRTKKTSTLSRMLKNEEVLLAEHTLADLDKDGKKELVVSSFTGGAHCCDEILIYRSAGPNKYQEAVRLYAGHTIIMPDLTFSYSLREHFGYFFTCYACAYNDTSDEAPLDVSRLTLNYRNGKMVLVQPDNEFKSIINDNLGKLSEQPYQKPGDDPIVDDGLRKEFALNVAAYYFTYGKNLAATQQLFNKYYKYPDAKKVWAACVKILSTIRAGNSF